MSLVFRVEVVDEFTKIILSAFGPFVGHHQGLLAWEKSGFKSLYQVFLWFYIIKKLRERKVG